MPGYSEALKVLNELGYDRFMPLQEAAFQNPLLYDSSRNIFVSGDTSSGKTLIPLIHYIMERRNNPEYKMLFLVPYRALVAQKQMEIEELLHRVFPGLRIVLSTGEYRENDVVIREGEVDVAVIIYEKAYRFFCKNDTFLKKYQTLVYDEFALVEDDARGVTCDLMLLCGQNAHCRLFVLSTPHYNWERYVLDGNFALVQTERGYSVPREETAIFLEALSKNGKACEFHDYREKPLELPGVRQCGTKDDLIEDLCVKHLQMNHRILVFMNNCQEVRRMAGALAKRLRQGNGKLLNKTGNNAEIYFQKILLETGLLEEDLIDLMTPDECLAFAQGIAYHNSWLGYELRTLIEREALTDDGILKVVFCTETMAYGINSNVDVVIVADMYKSVYRREYTPQRNEDGKICVSGKNILYTRFLSVNEYNNYIGRAGRFGRSDKGYSYALMTQKSDRNSVRKKWKGLLQQRSHPPGAQSTLMDLDSYCNWKEGCSYHPDGCSRCSLYANEFAMPVLSLIPVEGATREQIIRQMMRLPGLSQNRAWVEKNVSAALDCLIWKTRPDTNSYGWVKKEGNKSSGEPRYCLTWTGQIMSGFMVTMYEAKTMTRYLLGRKKYMPEARDYDPDQLKRLLERDPFDLFYLLCYLPDLQKIAFDFFEIPDVANESGRRQRRLYNELCTRRIKGYKRNAISAELYSQLMYGQTEHFNYKLKLPILYRTLLTIMIYEWYKTASVSELDKALNAEGQIVMITPGRVSRMSQQVSFYLQVTEALCQTLSHAAYKDIAQLLNRMELCLYFGIRESNARIIDAAQLRRLTRQQQLRVAHIMEFCSAHPSLDSPESLTRRQKSDWLNILKSLRSLPEKSSICQQLKEQFPILQIAEGVFDKN